MANNGNLRRLSPSEAREYGRRGGKASGESRVGSRLSEDIECPSHGRNRQSRMDAAAGGIRTGQHLEAAVNAAIIREALAGDVKAYIAIRDTLGQTTKSEADLEEQKIRTAAARQRPDRMLRKNRKMMVFSRHLMMLPTRIGLILQKKRRTQTMKKKRPIFKFQKFSRKQRQVFTWWADSSPVKDAEGIIADGAIRSGKTVSMSLSYVMWAMERFDGENFIMAGKTISSFKRNVLQNLKLMLTSRGYKWIYHISGDLPNMLEVTRKGKTNYFFIFGGKDEGSQDLVQGITAAGAFFDEVALMPESFVNQATGRLSVEGSKMWFNCNPAGLCTGSK